jgi:hypothetical protein
MPSAAVVNATVMRRLRALHRRGTERLEGIHGALRAADRHVEEFDDDLPKASLPRARERAFGFEENGGQALRLAGRWLTDLDSYADGHLPDDLRDRLRRAAPLPKRPVRRAGEGVGLLQYAQEFEQAVQARLDVLETVTGLSRSGDDLDDRAREHAGGWSHLRAGALIDPTVLDGYLTTMRSRRTRSDRGAALAAAKELLEAVCKGYLHTQDASLKLDVLDLPALWKLVRSHLVVDASVDSSLGSRDAGVAQLAGSLAGAIDGLAHVRNRVGGGHGRPTPPRGLAESHVLLAMDTTFALTRFIAQRHQEMSP